MNNSKWSSIITKNNTPFYIYDLNIVKNRVEQIKKFFPSFNLLYSVKANPHPKIISLLNKMDVGFDVASCNEIQLLTDNKVNSSKIYYSSPGKKENELEFAIGKSQIIADSINEIININNIAKSMGHIEQIGVRLNVPNNQMLQSKHEIMSGKSSKFGVSIEELKSINQDTFPYIDIVGIHIYFGSQILNENIITNNFNIISNTVLELKKVFSIKYINFGGGFGIPYEKTEKGLDLNLLSSQINSDKSIKELLSLSVQLNVELGRYIVAECGLFITTVLDIKSSFKKKYIIIDGGMNSFYRPIMTGDYHEIIQLNKTGKREMVTIVGRLCTPIDMYYEDIMIYSPQIGDKIIFKNAGAYGYTMSILNFISHTKPYEIIINGDIL